MRRKYFYGNAATSMTGDMICGTCNKPILEGDYRYHELSNRFVTHHRACTPRDPYWRNKEEEAQEYRAFLRARRVAIEEFVRRWHGDLTLVAAIEEVLA